MTPEERALKITEQIVIRDLAGGITGAEIQRLIMAAITEAVAEERERLVPTLREAHELALGMLHG